MRVILQEKIKKLGNIGDLVTVKPGYARNFLLSQGKALRATRQNLEVVEAKRKELEKLDAERKAQAQVRAKALESVGSLEIAVMCNSEGRLFGALNIQDVIKLFLAKGEKIEKSHMSVIGVPIRQIGTYEVHIECHAEVTAVIPLNVVSHEPEEEESSSKKGEKRAGHASENSEDALEEGQDIESDIDKDDEEVQEEAESN